MIAATIHESPRYVIDSFSLFDSRNIDFLERFICSTKTHKNNSVGVLIVFSLGLVSQPISLHACSHPFGGSLNIFATNRDDWLFFSYHVFGPRQTTQTQLIYHDPRLKAPLSRLQGIRGHQDLKSSITWCDCQTQTKRFTGNELNVLDSLIFRVTVDRAPLIFLPLPFISLFQLINPDLSINWTGGYDGAKLRPSPLDFPGRGSLNFDDSIVNPFVSFFDENPDEFVTASSCESSPSPVKAHVVDNDVGREISNAVDVYLRNHYDDMNK